jgi:hypothetical protein
MNISNLIEGHTKATYQSPPSSDSQMSKLSEVLKLVSYALSDPTMPFRPKLRPHKHAPLNHMARKLST